MQRPDRFTCWLVLGLSLTLLFSVSCSDDTSPPGGDGGVDGDTGITDSSLPDGYKLWPCEHPGKACNAHDPCAINPVCGPDKLCRPSALQNCDDGLDCTTDVCLGLGQCSNTPIAGYCALPVKITPPAGDGGVDSGGVPQTVMRCFEKDERSPNDACQVCEPDTDATKWQPANGGSCDDGNDCTKDDYCQSGVCKGSYYGNLCADNYGCTDDLCDGKGGCLGNVLKSDWCLISGVCYKDGQGDSTGCNRCDVSQSQSSWTALGVHCLIAGKCYMPGEMDSTKCSVCDPTKSTTSWTPIAGLCKIDGVCYSAGDKNTGGCAECDPTISATTWVVKGNACLINKVCKQPGDKDPTNCSSCEPAIEKYNWTPLAGLCQIDGACYSAGQKNTGGCAECDPTISATTWVVKGNACLINKVCKQPGDADPTGCSICDPTEDKYGWTPLANKCSVHGLCYADQAQDTSGCLYCSAGTDATHWTPLSGVGLKTYDFESGTLPGWTIVNSATSVGWQVSDRRSVGGSYALYYGDPVKGSFDSGSTNSGSATMPSVALPAGKKAGLAFALYMDTESSSSFDKLIVKVNSTTVWQKAVGSATVTMKTWQLVTLDLSSYAGQTVTVKFEFDSVDGSFNSGEGVFIDDLYLHYGC